MAIKYGGGSTSERLELDRLSELGYLIEVRSQDLSLPERQRLSWTAAADEEATLTVMRTRLADLHFRYPELCWRIGPSRDGESQ